MNNLFIKLKLQAGRGGDGIISWASNRYNTRMGPSGGNGGDGGTIFLSINKKLSDYSSITKYFWKAENGSPGRKEGKTGLSGKDVFISIPENTEIYDLSKKIKKITILPNSEDFPVCRGGRGGRGNKSFKSSKYQAPQLYELGEEGEKKEILLLHSEFKRVGVLNLLNIEETELQKYWENSKEEIYFQNNRIEFFDFPVEIFEKEKLNNFYSSHLDLCRLFICILHYDFLEKLEKLLSSIEKKLQNKGFEYLLKIVYTDNIKENQKNKSNCFFIPLEAKNSFLLSKLNEEFSKFQGLPSFKSDQNIDSEGYIEYSDEIFPEKEELKISKNENIWEIQSSRLNYWTSRIPQTTWHNLERLKEKLKLEEIMKIIKKNGGIEGEVIKIYNFEATLY
ncbi:DUF1967 domain-containing protein [Mycoplasma parvum]|uniref:Obg domain-containing protein n=1 Tax=Mycoplasma parvum str. Indiana TaxID=1403316 RepID=U5NCA8_9MOLU|nr:DUF1967 domain-containing protein [Mycoplasma parvum]AGX89216.1 hypothetical protein PRV_02395 [Mycoplasma parvum str. Indiana]